MSNDKMPSDKMPTEEEATKMLIGKSNSDDKVKSLDDSVAESLGAQQGATESDTQEVDMGKVVPLSEQKRLANIAEGYRTGVLKDKNFRELKPDKLPSRFDFYEIGRKIDVRAGTLEELLHVAGMNEGDAEDSTDKVNDIIDSCSRIMLGTGVIGDYRDLSQSDKLVVIFSIRDFALEDHRRENKLFMEVKNPKNGFVKKVEIDSNIFEYYGLKPGLMKWYNEKERCLIIESDSFESPLKLYIPTVGVIDYISNYVKKQEGLKKQGQGFYNPAFITEFQFLVPDWRLLDEEDVYLDKVFVDWKINFSYDKKATLQKAARMIEVGIKPNITVHFAPDDIEGGGSVTVPISFRNTSSIFDISDIASDLLGD